MYKDEKKHTKNFGVNPKNNEWEYLGPNKNAKKRQSKLQKDTVEHKASGVIKKMAQKLPKDIRNLKVKKTAAWYDNDNPVHKASGLYRD